MLHDVVSNMKLDKLNLQALQQLLQDKNHMSMYLGQTNTHWQHSGNSTETEEHNRDGLAFPLSDNLSALILVSLADLAQDQRNTLTSIMTHRARTLDQYNAQELRDLFLEMFLHYKNSS